MNAAGLRPLAYWDNELVTDANSIEDAIADTTNLPFTALIAFNVNAALRAIRILEERGLSVPEHVSIIGFDGVTIGQVSDPPLTTFAVERALLGSTSVERLQHRIQYPDSAIQGIALDTTLIPGGTVAKLRRT